MNPQYDAAIADIAGGILNWRMWAGSAGAKLSAVIGEQ